MVRRPPRPLVPMLAVALCAGSALRPAAAASRLVVWVPGEAGVPAASVERAFAWAQGAELLTPETVIARFPVSAEAAAQAAAAARADELLAGAERDFVETRFADAARALDECARTIDALAPTARAHAAWVRARLLAGRVHLAAGDAGAAELAFADAARAAPGAPLDEAEYPPEVVKAYEAARGKVRDQPARTVRVSSDPPGAEVEVNGRLWGRAPVDIQVTGGRCHVTVSRPGRKPAVIACADAPPGLAVRLEPADPGTVRDQLRERLLGDPRWFVEPSLLEALAVEAGATWVLALERARGMELEAHLYWTIGRRELSLSPPRYGAGQMLELGAAVRAVVRGAEGLRAPVVSGGVPGAPGISVRAGDPGAVARAVLHVRRTGAGAYAEVALRADGEGRFSGALPPAVLGPAGAALDVEYYVEGLDARGEACGSATGRDEPARYRRAAPVAPGARAAVAPRWYERRAVWAAAGGVLASAAAVAGYFLLAPDEVPVTFGRRP